MKEVILLKRELLNLFAEKIKGPLKEIASGNQNFREKAKLVNSLVASTRQKIAKDLDAGSISKQDQLIILEYCTTVSNLEFRNSVWSYEYMSLSRRMGELWERFCKTAWEEPVRKGIERVGAPSFDAVLSSIHNRIEPSVPEELKPDFANLIGLIDPINMIEDETFTVDKRLHVIDFKSGFGSNEKGNTLRLLAVGRAYKLFDPDTYLLFLVRQKAGNNYLNKIKASGLWEVHTGTDAYKKIDDLTGSSIHNIRSDLIDFENDLSKNFWTSLGSEIDEVKKYFEW